MGLAVTKKDIKLAADLVQQLREDLRDDIDALLDLLKQGIADGQL